jgi:phosphatidylinositol alpha 1,6-mannosyltransferase
MRITLVAEAFHPAVDGTTRTVKAVADQLVDSGHAVQLVAPGPGLASYRGCPVVRVGPAALRRRGRGGLLARGLAGFAPDLVHACGSGRLGRAARHEAERQGIPAYDASRGDWEPGVDAAAFSPVLRDPHLHTRWARARSRNGHGLDPLVVVGFVGRLEAGHGARRLAALAAVPGIRPVVVGDGPLLGWLRTRLPDARFTGPLGTGDLAVGLASMDVLVHPGPDAGCCSVLREAAASGVPVVAPATPATRRVVRTLESGLLHDPDDPHGLPRAVAAMAADPHRALLGGRARELVTGRDWATAVDELVRCHYAPLVGRRARIPAIA